MFKRCDFLIASATAGSLASAAAAANPAARRSDAAARLGALLPWAPVTRKNVAKGSLSIAAPAQAAQEMSDGATANLLV